jgi:hypothetical protein
VTCSSRSSARLQRSLNASEKFETRKHFKKFPGIGGCGGLLQLATQAWVLNRKSVVLEVQVVALDDDGLMSHGQAKEKKNRGSTTPYS